MPDAFDLLDDAVTTDKGSILDYDASSGEAFGGSFDRQFDTNPLAFVGREARFLQEDFASLFLGTSERVDQKVAEEEVRSRGLDLKIPVGGISRVELDMLQYLKQREVRQNTVAARTRSVGAIAAGFAGGFAGGALDPINVASGFIPVVSQYRYAQWLARAGEGVLARSAVRAGAGAIEGAVGAALVEPIIYAGATSEQLDYGLTDSFANVVFGGLLGGGLHVIARPSPDRTVAAALGSLDIGLRESIGNAPEFVKRDALQSAVAAMERGDPVDVTPHFAAQATEARAKAEQDIATLRAEIDAVKAAETADADVRIAQLEARIDEVKAVAPPPEAVATFTTAKGSVYQLHADGTTTRNKAFRPEHGFDEQGRQPTSDVTVYLTQDQAAALATPQGSWRMFLHDDGTVSLISKNKSGEWGISPSSKNIAVQTQPQAGLIPLELWNADAAVGGKRGVAYKRIHFGNKIVDVAAAPQQRVGGSRGLADLIPQARAERTEAAFARQFVDQADETLAAEKAKPKDKIDAVKVDEADWAEVVEQYRGEGRVTPEDDARLKRADELAAWAERRARAFEAAAGCIEAS